MEKNKRNIFIRMKPTCTAVFLSFIFSTQAQKLATFKNYCGSFYKNMDHPLKLKQKEIAFYDFRSGQTIAGTGAQCRHRDADLNPPAE